MSELSRDARMLLEAAKAGDRPREGDRARIRAKLAEQIGGPLNAPPSPSGATGGSALALKIVAVVVMMAGASALLWLRDTPPPKALVLVPASLPAPKAPLSATLPAPVAPLQPLVAKAAPTRTVRRRDDPALNLELEAQLLGEARLALAAKDPERALRLADEHARRFLRGALTPERLAARAMALCALDRRAEAKDARERLAEGSFGSSLLDRVEEACGRRLDHGPEAIRRLNPQDDETHGDAAENP